MKSFQMKALAAAVLGLGGLVMAGSAFAATCPAGPAIADGGAWTSKTQLSNGHVAIVQPGLAGTSCAMASSFTAGASSISLGTVTDQSPNNEARYRFRFYINKDALGSFGTFDGVQIANVLSATPFPASGGRRNVMTISMVPSATGVTLSFFVACNNSATVYRCASTMPVDLAAGGNSFEVDMPFSATAGTNSTIRYWLNAAAGSTDATTPTGTIVVDNSGWSVKSFSMGMANPTSSFVSTHVGQNLVFDEFDSRRQTYIGP